jgi:predicted permease
VGTASHLPLSFEINVEGLAAEGREPGMTRSWPAVDAASVGPGYFETLGIPLLRGRPFDTRDVHGTRRIAIVNETLARRFWPEEDPIGRRVRFEDQDELWTVVGVARDGRYRTLGEAPRPFLYRPIAQVGQVDRVILVKHTGAASLVLAALRDDARQVAERVPLVGLGTLEDALAMTLLLPRSGATLFGLLGLLGLVLACAGLYGVIAYLVSRRTREIGIRMALGASPARVLTLVVSGGLRLVAVGLGLGLLLAAGASRALEAALYGVSPTDGTTFTVVSSLLIVTAVLACLVPARRASRVDPMRALRCE